MTGSARRRAGLRRGRIAAAGALAATAVMAFGVSSAQATSHPFSAQFDNANLNIGPAFDILTPVSPPAGDATMTGTIDDVTGNFTVPANQFVFPPFSGPVLGGAATVGVALSALQPITGHVDQATGAVTTDPTNYEALVDVTISGTDHCKIDTPFGFSTAADYPAPFKGEAFDSPIDLASDPVSALNNGALVTTWPSLTAVPVSGTDDCTLLQSLVGGRGGLWIANGLAEPTPTSAPPSSGGAGPAPTTPAATKKKKCKKAKKGSASASKKSKCKKKK
jgi:hypothetical protein